MFLASNPTKCRGSRVPGTGTIFFGDAASSAAAGFRYNHNTGDMAISAEDNITFAGWNMYMTPEQAARGLTLMLNYPEHMPDLIENEGRGYKDLTDFDLYKDC